MEIQRERSHKKISRNRTLEKIECSTLEKQCSQHSTFKNNVTMYRGGKSQKISIYLPLNKKCSKENLVRIYHSPKLTGPLPALQKVGQQKGAKGSPDVSQSKEKPKKNFDLLDYGIFTEHRTCEAFLKKLKNTT